MEAFSLLKYWRGGGGGCAAFDGGAATKVRGSEPTTIVSAVSAYSSESEDDDDGPFFDLEFAVEDDGEGGGNARDGENVERNCGAEEDEEEEDDDDSEEDERGFNFELSPGSSADGTDPNVALSPADDLFFNGRLVPVEPSESISKSQFSASLLKSATKFRVMMLKLKKSKSGAAERDETSVPISPNRKPRQKKQPENQSEKQNQTKTETQSKFFTVKLNVEEVPIMSLFSRDNSSKGSKEKTPKRSSEEPTPEEKRFSKEAMHRYLKMVKPLYIRVSKRYGDKLRFSGQLSLSGAAAKALQSPPSTAEPKSPPPTNNETEQPEASEPPKTNTAKTPKPGNIPAGLREVCKHLGKSKSASSAVAAAPPGPTTSKRRDDSLLQQQDGIQSAILHCKRSFNSSRDYESLILPRSASDQSTEKSTIPATVEADKEIN